MQKMPRYGILGGTFDPPHIGHLALAQEAHSRLGLDRVWFVPTGAPPHKPGQPVSAADDRVAMVERAIAGDARFALSTVELELAGPSYTIRTLGVLRQRWGADAWICFVMGWDMLAYLPKWRDPAGVVAAVDAVAAAHRPGYPATDGEVAALAPAVPGLSEKLAVLPGPLLDISATGIRDRVASGLPVRYLVLDSVRHYIEERGLYRDHGVSSGTATGQGRD
jgi:nicotinate-nucleotide adenylyltransferase